MKPRSDEDFGFLGSFEFRMPGDLPEDNLSLWWARTSDLVLKNGVRAWKSQGEPELSRLLRNLQEISALTGRIKYREGVYLVED